MSGHAPCACCQRQCVENKSLTCSPCQDLNRQFIDNLRIFFGADPLYGDARGDRAATRVRRGRSITEVAA